MNAKTLLRSAGTVAWRILRAGLLAGARATLDAARQELEATVAAGKG